MQTGTIKVSVFYPNGKDKTFDMDYYIGKHVPLVLALMGNDAKLGALERGLHGETFETSAPYLMMAHLYFNSLESFKSVFLANEAEIRKDMPNFTNSIPIIQVSEVIV